MTEQSTPGPLADLDGDLGAEARRLVAALYPHPTALADTEEFAARLARKLDDPEAVAALRYVIETAISRASAVPMVPRGDQPGERVAGRAEPPLEARQAFCGFHSMHPAHTWPVATSGPQYRCLGMDAAGPRG